MNAPWRGALMSTTARFIALAFVLQVAATGSILAYVRHASALAKRSDQQALVIELRNDLLAGFQEGNRAGLIALINARLREVRTEAPVILLAASDGRFRAGNIAAWPPTIARKTSWTTLELYRQGSAQPERIGFIARDLPNGDRLLTGHVIENDVRQAQIDNDAMIAAFVLAIPLALLIAALTGRIVTQRIGRIADTTAAVRGGDLSRRVPLSGGGDAFEQLGAGVNAMLEQIEMLVSELRIVTDGLAHDLRSPITRLKSILERAIVETHDPHVLATLGKVATEADTLLTMLTTALQISRAEAGIGRDRFVDTNVHRLLDDIVEVFGPYAEDQGFMLTVTAPPLLSIALLRELVSQAVGNLIENALKYADGGNVIALEAEATAQGVAINVADNGAGIAEHHRAAALRRYGRLDPARHQSGSGLGLSLVDAVARLHGGGVSLADNRPGLRVTMTISRGRAPTIPPGSI